MEAELEGPEGEYQILLRLSEDELLSLANSLNEAIEAIEDWEFPIRLGVDKSAARNLRYGLTRQRTRSRNAPREFEIVAAPASTTVVLTDDFVLPVHR